MGISARTTLPFFFSTALALCPPPGALLPPPTLESVSSNFSIPESVFSRLSFLGNNSFAIQASIGDVNVYEYEHSAPGRELNQTLFKTKSRIASATKMITSLALALSSDLISLEDPITKYIPGLDEDLYAGVTVGSLADHTSGLGRFVCLSYSRGEVKQANSHLRVTSVTSLSSVPTHRLSASPE